MREPKTLKEAKAQIKIIQRTSCWLSLWYEAKIKRLRVRNRNLKARLQSKLA